MRIIINLSVLITLVISPSAFALDLDYYTWGGFSETVLAFQRASLLFNHSSYESMIAIAAVFGILFGGTLFFMNSITEGFNGFPLKFLLIPFLGAAIYQGVVLPKGTVHIYDETRNSYEAVGNVPDVIVLLSGVWNKFERMAAEIEAGSSAYPYEESAGGIGFNLLFNVSTSRKDFTEHYLKKSIKTFYKDCSEVPLAVPGSGFDIETLKSGTNDIYAYMDDIAWVSTSTTYYNSINKNGVPMSCQDAWIDNLKPALAVNELFERPLERVCESVGFNPSQLEQLQACKGLMDDLGINMFGVNTGHISLMRNALIASIIAEAMAEENPDVATRVLTNRDMMTDGIGAAINSQEWVMTFRSIMLTVVLGLIPFLVVFLVTPLCFKALFLISGLFAWAAIWGIVDVVSNGMAIDHSFRVMEEIRTHGLGLEAFLSAPSDSMKAMSIFGKIRGYGALISTIVTSALFGFSGYALSNMASNWQQSIEKSGTESADKSINPEQRGRQYNDMTSGQATESNISKLGYSAVAAGASFQSGTTAMASSMESQLLQNQGMDVSTAMAASASIRAGESAGTTTAVMQASGGGSSAGLDMPMTPGPMAAMSSTAAHNQKTMNLASNEGVMRAARNTGVPIQETAHNTAVMSHLKNVSEGQVLESMGNKDLISGYYGNSMSNVNGGRIMDHVSASHDGGGAQFYEDLAANRFGRDFATFSTAAMLSEKLDQPVFDSAVQMNESGFSLMVTPNNYNDLVKGGLLSSEQQETLTNDGMVGRLDFAYDSGTGHYGDSTTSSGNRGLSNNNQTITSTDTKDSSTRVDNSHRHDSSTTVTSAYNEDRGFNVQAQTVSRVALNPEMRGELSNILRMSDNQNDTTTSPEELQVDRGLAESMSSVINKSVTDMDASRLMGNIGASVRGGVSGSAGFSLLGNGGKAYVDASANAGLDQSWSATKQDSLNHNSNLHEARMIRENSITEGRDSAHQEVLRRNAERIERGDEAYSVDEMEKLKSDLTYQYAADSYHAQSSDWFDDALEKNKSESEEMESSVVRDKLEEVKGNIEKEEEKSGNPGSQRKARRG